MIDEAVARIEGTVKTLWKLIRPRIRQGGWGYVEGREGRGRSRRPYLLMFFNGKGFIWGKKRVRLIQIAGNDI